MLLFRDQIQDSYSGSSRSVLIRDLRSCSYCPKTEMPDQVRHDGNGLSSRCVHAEPALICSYSGSSRSAPIRDLRSYQTLDPKPHTRFFVSPSLFISCFCSSDQEPGREASELRTKLLALERSPALSKDGSMILDDGRGTSLPLLTLFSEDGERRTEDVS